MNIAAQTKLINELLALSSARPSPRATAQAAKIRLAYNNGAALRFLSDARKRFDDAVKSLHRIDAEVGDRFSRKMFEHKVVALMLAARAESRDARAEEVEALWLELRTTPPVSHRVFVELQGATLGTGEPLTLGPFRVFDWGRHRNLIEDGQESPEWFWSAPHRTLLECRTNVCDSQRSLELAERKFVHAEAVFRFTLGYRSDRCDVAVFDHRGPRYQHIYSIGGGALHSSSSLVGAFEPIDLTDPCFTSPAPSLVRLFEIANHPNSPIEQRIQTAMKWIADAISDPLPATSLIKSATAVEILCSFGSGGPITPSIMAQISECCASVLGTSRDNALEIERELKELYAKRSAVVHAGGELSDESAADRLISIARRLVISLLTDQELSVMSTPQQLSNWLRNRRYAACERPSTARLGPDGSSKQEATADSDAPS